MISTALILSCPSCLIDFKLCKFIGYKYQHFDVHIVNYGTFFLLQY